jgi:hypothetical protein
MRLTKSLILKFLAGHALVAMVVLGLTAAQGVQADDTDTRVNLTDINGSKVVVWLSNIRQALRELAPPFSVLYKERFANSDGSVTFADPYVLFKGEEWQVIALNNWWEAFCKKNGFTHTNYHEVLVHITQAVVINSDGYVIDHVYDRNNHPVVHSVTCAVR